MKFDGCILQGPRTAEAKVVHRLDGRDALEIDPITLMVLAYGPDGEIPALADGNDQSLANLMGALMDDDSTGVYALVWSEFGNEVLIGCPACQDVILATDAHLGGDGELHCGCDEY